MNVEQRMDFMSIPDNAIPVTSEEWTTVMKKMTATLCHRRTESFSDLSWEKTVIRTMGGVFIASEELSHEGYHTTIRYYIGKGFRNGFRHGTQVTEHDKQ